MSAWPMVPLGDICKPKQWPIISKKDLTESGYPTYGAGGHIGYTDRKTHDEDVVLVGCRGTCGNIMYGRGPLYASGNAMALDSLSDRVSPAYLAHALRWRGLREVITGSSQPQITRTNLVKVQVPLPSQQEQRRIVQLLDHTQAISDRFDGITSFTARQGRALFRKMFGDPVRDWSGESKKYINEIGRVQLGRQRAPKYQTGDHSHPYMRVANVLENRISLGSVNTMDFDAKDFAAYKLEYGDILLNEGQSTELVGRPAMWRDEIADCCFQNTLVRFQADRSIVDPAYTLWLFLELYKAGEFAKISSKTSNLAHLGAGRFGDMKVPVPPLGQQREFVRQITKLGELTSTATTAQERAHELYDSLQYRAFRGEL